MFPARMAAVGTVDDLRGGLPVELAVVAAEIEERSLDRATERFRPRWLSMVWFALSAAEKERLGLQRVVLVVFEAHPWIWWIPLFSVTLMDALPASP